MKSKAKIKPQTKNQAQDTETRLMVARDREERGHGR